MPPTTTVRVGSQEVEVTPEERDAILRVHARSKPGAVADVTDAEKAARITEATISDSSKGATGWLAANTAAALDTVTGGVSTHLLGESAQRAMRERDTTVGTIAGFIPGMFTGGAEVSAGRAVLGGLPGLAGKAGAATAKALGGGRAARVVGGALEGAIGGVGALNRQAALSNDPLTVESALADVGLGAFFNAGFGALGRGVAKAGDGIAARVARDNADVVAREAMEGAAPAYGALREDMKAAARVEYRAASTARKAADDAVRAADEALADVPAAVERSVRGAMDANLERLGVITRAEAKIGKRAFDLTDVAEEQGVDAAFSARRTQDLAIVEKALKSGKVDDAVAYANKVADEAHAGHMRLGAIEGLGPVPDGGYRVMSTAERTADARAAVDQARAAAAAAPVPTAAPKLPKTIEEFARIQPVTVAQLDAAIAANPATQKSVAAVAEGLGVTVSEGEGMLAAIQRHVKDVNALPASAAKSGKRSWLARLGVSATRGAAGRAADKALGGGAKGAAGRAVAGGLAGMAVGGLPGILVAAEVTGSRVAVQGQVRRAAASILPRTGRAIQKASPAMARLMAGPDGKREKGTTQEIALRRFDEVARQAVAAPDASFEAVRHVIPAGVDAAAGIQHKAIGISNYLVSVMPKDPGTAQAQFKSFWKPSNEQVQKFASQHLAATDPLAAIEYMAEGNVDIAMAESLRQNWPALFHQFRKDFIEALPAMGTLPHGQLMAYSVMLGQPLHGLQSAENIAYFQAEVHGPKHPPAEPKQPQTFTPGAPPSRSSSPGGGVSPQSMTQAQRLQNR